VSFKGKFWIVVLLTFGAVIVTSLIAHLKPYRYFAPINHPSADHVLYYQYMRKPVDVLIFGSSKVKYGVRMEIVREELDRAGMNQVTAAKLAVPGIVILGEYLVIRDLLRGPFRPRLLVLEVAERNFSRNAGRVINDLQAFGTPRDMASFLWREARPSERGKVLEGIIRGPYFTFNMVARMAAGFLGSKGRNAILETKPDLTPEMLEVLEQDTWKKKREMLCGIEADSVMERYDITPYMRNVTSALIRTGRGGSIWSWCISRTSTITRPIASRPGPSGSTISSSRGSPGRPAWSSCTIRPGAGTSGNGRCTATRSISTSWAEWASPVSS